MTKDILLTSIIQVCLQNPNFSEIDITFNRCTSSGVPIMLPRVVNADLIKAWKTFMSSNKGFQIKEVRIYKENSAFCIVGTAYLVKEYETTD